MKTSLAAEVAASVGERLRQTNAAHTRRYPGESGRRQPVHTVYGGAHLFKADSAQRLGELARRALERYASDPLVFARALGLPGGEPMARTIYQRVAEKLAREPVEDFRIDFEDGYGTRPDEEEDKHAALAAEEAAAGMASGKLPPFVGIRIKPFFEDTRARSVRTLDIFLTWLMEKTGGALPPNFVTTLPKVSAPEHVAALADLFDALEPRLGLAAGSLRIELMIETPQSILNLRGESALPHLVEAARGRCVAAHFGTYDYTASCNITAAHQRMTHASCDFARLMMQTALAGTGVWLSDGATNVLPVPLHRAAEGSSLTPQQEEENRRGVHRAWKIHYDDIQHSLINGSYPGWDLHPAQLPTRYAAVYAFFLDGLEAAAERLRTFVEKAARATLVGDIFDDAATGQALLNYFLRAINCGAMAEAEALPLTGLSLAEIRLRSFAKILAQRRRA
ncbi:MAG: DUF6986 family protein [Candidatus Acidiferrales bacterium]